MITDANKTLAEIHYKKGRMPVIFPRNLEKSWLNKSISPTELLKLCIRYTDSLRKRTRVDKRVNSVNRKNKPNNNAGLILPLNTD